MTQHDEAPKHSHRAPPRSLGRREWLILAAAGVVILVIGGVIGGLISSNTASSSTASTNTLVCPATTVADNVLPSIVTISARNGATGGTGSGEIIRSDGYILTNNHVISLAVNGGSVDVTFADGTTVPATITGRDPQADLAVIKVNVSEGLPVIAFGSSSDLVVGQPVVVLGAPLGLSNTVTTGIVSALDRSVQVPGDNGQTALLVSAIQSDAAINPGNSGGAMTNCDGQLVGVPSAGAVVPSPSGESSGGSIGLGFAIPSDFAKMVSDEIISTGTVTHAYFGIDVTTVPPSAAQRLDSPEGLYVAAVVPGGPSAAAGLQEGDIITEINGQPATSPTQLEELTLTKRAGDTVSIKYDRAGKSYSTTITLGAAP